MTPITLERNTRETRIRLGLGAGETNIRTSEPVLSHFLEQLAFYAGLELSLSADEVSGLRLDTASGSKGGRCDQREQVVPPLMAEALQPLGDGHHLAEDVAILLGRALDQALGDRTGLARYGQRLLPMDEALATCALDLGGRPFPVVDLPLPVAYLGSLATENIPHFFRTLALEARLTLHLTVKGDNAHHMAEAAFKAVGLALSEALAPSEGLRSTKGGAAMIGILDYGCGNLKSLENALAALGQPSLRVSTPEGLEGVERLILPGVGHFAHAIGEMRARGLEEAVARFARGGSPLLGICLGMQLLFEGSDEAPGVPGLGLLQGHFRSFEGMTPKVPHMGWSRLDFKETTRSVYFVHSYFLPAWSDPRPTEKGLAVYGGPFVAAFRAGRLGGFQFHPEKSGREGLELLKEALAW